MSAGKRARIAVSAAAIATIAGGALALAPGAGPELLASAYAQDSASESDPAEGIQDPADFAAPPEEVDDAAAAAAKQAAPPAAPLGTGTGGASASVGSGATGSGGAPAPAPAARPSGSPAIDPAVFARLPEHEVSLPPDLKMVRVGDVIDVAVPGVSVPPSAEGWKVEPAAGSASLIADGYDLQPASRDPAPGAVEFAVVPLKSGPIVVPALVIRDPAGEPLARTRPFSLQVAAEGSGSDPQAEEPAPPLPPTRIRFPLWIAVALGAGVILLVVGLFYAMVRMARGPAPAPLPELKAPRPEDVLALEALDAVAGKGLVPMGKHKAHYFTVSEILKRYLGARFKFDASESTTSELLERLRADGALGEEALAGVKELFGRLDLVKFTDHVPSEEDGAKVVEDARQLVQRTRRVAQAAPILESSRLRATDLPDLKGGSGAV